MLEPKESRIVFVDYVIFIFGFYDKRVRPVQNQIIVWKNNSIVVVAAIAQVMFACIIEALRSRYFEPITASFS